MSLAALVRNLAAAGASPEAIALAVEAVEGAGAQLDARRAADRERKARERARRREAREVIWIDDEDDQPQLDLSPEASDATAEPSRDASADNRAAPPTSSSSLPPRPPNPTTPPPPEITTRVRTADFERFWEAYPRRVGRRTARDAWAKAALALGQDGPAVILAAAQRAAEAWTDAQFIPHPATWLNREGWHDEISPQPETPMARTHDRHRPLRSTDQPDLRRANTVARRDAWLEIVAERGGLPAGADGYGG